MRVLLTADEHVLSLARERKIDVNFHFMPPLTDRKVDIPVIAVFTKYDTLVKEQLRRYLDLSTAEKNAENYFNDRVQNNDRVRNFQQRMQVSVVKVSTSDDYTGMSPSCCIEMRSHLGHC